MKRQPYSRHIVIPDTQCHPGTPLEPLRWIGNYIVEEFAGRDDVKIVHLGDHADMPSLSSYDKPGSKQMEGRRYLEDIKAANEGWGALNEALWQHNQQQAKTKHKRWNPERHILLGNHENRITRAIDTDPVRLEGVLSLGHLDYARTGWRVHGFLDILWLDGVAYSHYAVTPMTGRPMGGQAQLQLQKLGHSMITGHQQTLDYAVRYTRNDEGRMRSIHRIIAGAAYAHHEDYLGPQGNDHWRGILVLNEVRGGSFDPMFVSLDYLCRRYEGRTLADWQEKRGLVRR
jgi:hypothetical protein